MPWYGTGKKGRKVRQGKAREKGQQNEREQTNEWNRGQSMPFQM